ncbi:MAG: hypothetical protein EOM87_00710 [Clostridia bacterium]|nr:hypothetical protein [Clostridia bacterium]
MTLRQGKGIFFLPLLMIIGILLIFVPSITTAHAVEAVIDFDAGNRSNDYGEFFWFDATVRGDGRLQYRGEINGTIFSKSDTGNYYLVFEPYGIISGGIMTKLTDNNGKITAPPGTYTLSGSPSYYLSNDYADILNSEGTKIYDKIKFNPRYTYTINPRPVTVNVDDTNNTIRYYGGPTIDLDYTIVSGNMVNDDILTVEFSSEGNAQIVNIGAYDIFMDSFSVINGGIDKTHYYSVVYQATGRPLLDVEKYVIVAEGVGDLVDVYRYDGDHTAVLNSLYEEIPGINEETVRIYYTLDEASIVRVNGALPVSAPQEAYPTIVNVEKVEVYSQEGLLVDHKENYEINSLANNTRLIVNKRDIVLYSGEGEPLEDGVYINPSIITEIYGYTFEELFDRDIEVLGENINFAFNFTEYYELPEVGLHSLTLVTADNPWYNIELDESFCFVINKYTLLLFEYLSGEGEVRYIDVEYGVGLPQYSSTVTVSEAFEQISFTLNSSVDENSAPGVHDFTSYIDNRNFIIDYTNVKILVALKPLTVSVVSQRPTGVEYGDEYSIVLVGAVDARHTDFITSYCVGATYTEASAVLGLPFAAGAYKIRCAIDNEALDFYSLGELGYVDVSFNIAKRNIIVRYDLNQSTKEYNSEVSIEDLGVLSNYYEANLLQAGLINGDILSGNITCSGLAKTAAAGGYVVNVSALNNNNYTIVGGVKVYFGGAETPSLTVTKLRAQNLPVFLAAIASVDSTSVTLNNISINGTAVGAFTISSDGGNNYASYKTSNTFTGLIPGKRYYFKVRIKSDSNIEQGAESQPISQVIPLLTPTVKSTAYSTDSLTVELNGYSYTGMTYSYQYRLNAGDWRSSGVFDDLQPGTRYQIRYKCTSSDSAESPAGSLYLWTANVAPVIIEEELSLVLEATRIFIEGLEETYEYRIALRTENPEEMSFSGWVTLSDFTDLEDESTYVIEVRVKASQFNGNVAGEITSLTLSTPAIVIVEIPIHYEGIMAYVGDYYLAGLLAFMFLMMIIFITGFAKKIKIV